MRQYLLLLVVLLSACATTETQIVSARFSWSYDASTLARSARAGGVSAHVIGNPTTLPAEEARTRIAALVRLPSWAPTQPVRAVAGDRREGYRLVLGFDTLTGTLCAAGTSAESRPTPFAMRLNAAFCLGDGLLSEATAVANGRPEIDSPGFAEAPDVTFSRL
ncbi:MAG: hypothetical protein FJX46_02585 [Alphaproteobacteria bacterium]|nr:hypothetical protein [Alphaproteobacteria bacterium]